MLRALGGGAVAGLAGCLGGDDGGDDTGDGGGDDVAVGSGGDGGDADPGAKKGDESAGTLEVTFLGETHAFDDASCEDRDLATFPPGLRQLFYRNYDEEFAFWVNAWDPDDPDVPGHVDPDEVEVHVRFPTDPTRPSVDVEAYEGHTTSDEIEFEPGSGTSGVARLEPSGEMAADVDHEPDGGTVEWSLSC